MKVPVAYGVDTVIAGFLPEEGMTEVAMTNLTPGYDAGWLVMRKPFLWILAVLPYSLVLLVATTIPGHSRSVRQALGIDD